MGFLLGEVLGLFLAGATFHHPVDGGYEAAAAKVTPVAEQNFGPAHFRPVPARRDTV